MVNEKVPGNFKLEARNRSGCSASACFRFRQAERYSAAPKERLMKVSILLAIVTALSSGVASAQLGGGSERFECPVTEPNGSAYGNEALQAIIGSGRFVFEPGGPGFVDYDGALGIKFAWVRLIPGRLFVGGRRLDDEAAPARAYIYDYGNEGFQPIYLVFPTPGCWEITGGVSGATLTFVVDVEKIGDGPSWKTHGPPANRRVTTHWLEQ
jgi:hypothetical protein